MIKAKMELFRKIGHDCKRLVFITIAHLFGLCVCCFLSAVMLIHGFPKNSCPSRDFILGGSATAIFVLKSKSAMPESVHSCPTSFGDVVQFWLLEFYNNEATLKPQLVTSWTVSKYCFISCFCSI